MAEKPIPEVEPLDDTAFMNLGRARLSNLTPMQRSVVLWFLTADEDPDHLGNVLDVAFELVSLAAALKEPEKLEPSVKWLKGQLETARITFSDRDHTKPGRRTRKG